MKSSPPKKYLSSTSLNEAFKCDICDKGYASQMGLYYHKQTVHNPPKYACPVCKRPFHRTFTLKNHLAKAHCLSQCFHCFETFPINQQSIHVCKNCWEIWIYFDVLDHFLCMETNSLKFEKNKHSVHFIPMNKFSSRISTWLDKKSYSKMLRDRFEFLFHVQNPPHCLMCLSNCVYCNEWVDRCDFYELSFLIQIFILLWFLSFRYLWYSFNDGNKLA